MVSIRAMDCGQDSAKFSTSERKVRRRPTHHLITQAKQWQCRSMSVMGEAENYWRARSCSRSDRFTSASTTATPSPWGVRILNIDKTPDIRDYVRHDLDTSQLKHAGLSHFRVISYSTRRRCGETMCIMFRSPFSPNAVWRQGANLF